MPTHIRAEPGAVAPGVLLTGDPQRAEELAARHLEGVRRYNSYRALTGLTGRYRGRELSIQATGMGGPSTAIVLEELHRLGARAWVRLGTCGALDPSLALGDGLIASSACNLTGAARDLAGLEGHAAAPDPALLCALMQLARERGAGARAGPIASLDLFYDPRPELQARLARLGVLALEMEASTVFTLGAIHRCPSACLLVVSDLIAQGERASPEVIAAGLDRLVPLALEALAGLPA
ncbi:MAG TPA: purine-nucleoside phosphorylase [Myxococcota bacterium]|nr:purine-nucleoside phosphorylase [Myxococcota bacterium]HRY94275.1 purine-nucleoside phosphorylase [Myxococcota bacterium]HSA21404.1 purine-nucleoside phosphorylase [Myxococcota bacterium]